MTLTVTATARMTTAPGVLIDVACSPPVIEEMSLYRVHSDGTRYRVITDRAVIIGGSWIETGWSGTDYHAPFNQPVTYVVETATQTATSAATFLVSKRWWLIHPGNPALSVLVDSVMELADYKYSARFESFDIIGRSLPVNRSVFPRGGQSGSMTVKCATEASRAKLKALFADGGPLLINSPYTDDEVGWKWVQPGDLSLSNPAGKHWFGYRAAQFDYQECVMPEADLVPEWTFDKLNAAFPNLTAVSTAYSNFRNLSLDIRNP